MSDHVLNIKIAGMTCGGCSSRVKRTLEEDERIISADICHETDSGTVHCSTKLSVEELISLVNMTGFKASY